jgi:hypothetical protein
MENKLSATALSRREPVWPDDWVMPSLAGGAEHVGGLQVADGHDAWRLRVGLRARVGGVVEDVDGEVVDLGVVSGVVAGDPYFARL